MAQVNTFTCSVDLQDFCHGNDAKANCEGRGTCHRICQLPQYIVLRDELSLRQKNKILIFPKNLNLKNIFFFCFTNKPTR